MPVTGFWAIFGLGCLGGALVEILRWWKLREAPEFPTYARRFGYWLITGSMILAGGIVATLYGLEKSNAVMVVNLGASTPAIIGALAAQPPQRGQSPAAPTLEQAIEGASWLGSIRKFLAFGS